MILYFNYAIKLRDIYSKKEKIQQTLVCERTMLYLCHTWFSYVRTYAHNPSYILCTDYN